jgi:hypothetical protein
MGHVKKKKPVQRLEVTTSAKRGTGMYIADNKHFHPKLLPVPARVQCKILETIREVSSSIPVSRRST